MTTILGHNMTLLAIFDFWMTNVLQPAHSESAADRDSALTSDLHEEEVRRDNLS